MVFYIIQHARIILCSVLAYVLSVTLSGAIKAWVAKKAGDRTAQYAGFLTLDPLVHIDPFGLIIAAVAGVGWGNEVPVDIYNIDYPARDLKILAIYYAQTIVHILLTSIAILLHTGIEVVQLLYVGHCAFGITLELVLQSFVKVNIFLAMLRFIQASMDLICTHLIERDPASMIYIRLGSLIVSLLIVLLIGTHMQMFFVNISYSLASWIVSLIVRLVA